MSRTFLGTARNAETVPATSGGSQDKQKKRITVDMHLEQFSEALTSESAIVTNFRKRFGLYQCQKATVTGVRPTTAIRTTTPPAAPIPAAIPGDTFNMEDGPGSW